MSSSTFSKSIMPKTERTTEEKGESRMKQQSERLGVEPIPQLLVQLAVPAVVGLLVMSLHNVIDAIYISYSVGTIGMAAVSVAFPIQMLVMAVAGAFGIGGGSLISIALGANDVDRANRVFGNITSLVLIFSLAAALLGLTILEPMLTFFGASATILPYACDYQGIILYSTVFFAFAFAMNNVIRAEGNAKTAMLSMIISAILNIIFTPIFIYGFGMGIKGAAVGTIVAQGITAVYLVYYFLSGRSSLSLKKAYLIPKLDLIKQILAIGASPFVRQSSGSIMLITANNLLNQYGGDLALAVMGINFRIIHFVTVPILGILQGLLPLVGFNYGARQGERVSASIKLGLKAASAIAISAFILVMTLPKYLIMIFTNDPAAIAMGQKALRVMFAFAFTIGIQIVTGGIFQALGNARVAFFLSLSRQIIFLIPLLLLLPLALQLSGIWAAFAGADLLSFFVSLWFINRYQGIFFKASLPELPATKT